jgi:hypothetical protein
VRIALVRLRFPLLLLAVALLVGYWDTIRNHWDKLTRPAVTADGALSSDTEYWCPMCPGVLSDWPGKCPVCNMALVRRKRGEMVPLPNGVVARVQLSPYRVQLAGIRTAPADYRPLTQEATLAGFVQADDEKSSPATVGVEVAVFEKDIAFVTPGRKTEVVSGAFPGQTFPGRVGSRAPRSTPGTRTLRSRLVVEDPRHELLSGMFVTARCRVPVAELGWFTRAWREDWRDRTALSLAAQALGTPAGPTACGGVDLLLRAAAEHALHCQGRVLAVPEGAVVDTGAKKVVFVEAMPTVFDALEVVVGRRCGGFYPVLRGLEPGQQVVTAGAFLLDAETRLNPGLAASYFGAGRGTAGPGGSSSATTVPASGEPTAEDRALLARQEVCPVTGERLDSMGGPVRVVVEGQTVFLCCKSCEAPLRKDPARYLGTLRRK